MHSALWQTSALEGSRTMARCSSFSVLISRKLKAHGGTSDWRHGKGGSTCGNCCRKRRRPSSPSRRPCAPACHSSRNRWSTPPSWSRPPRCAPAGRFRSSSAPIETTYGERRRARETDSFTGPAPMVLMWSLQSSGILVGAGYLPSSTPLVPSPICRRTARQPLGVGRDPGVTAKRVCAWPSAAHPQA